MMKEVLAVSAPPPRLFVLAAALAAIGLWYGTNAVGCAAVQKAGAIVEDVIVDCGIPAVESEVSDLLDQAGAILQGGDADWARQLDNLTSNAVWAGYCAVQVVLQDLTPPAPTSARLAPVSPAAVRAEAYLAAHRVRAEHAGTGDHYRALKAAKHASATLRVDANGRLTYDPPTTSDQRGKVVGLADPCAPSDLGGCPAPRLVDPVEAADSCVAMQLRGLTVACGPTVGYFLEARR